MRIKRSAFLVLTAVLVSAAAMTQARAEEISITSWRADDIDLYDGPNGAVVKTRPASTLATPMHVLDRASNGQLHIRVDGVEYYVDASQARTNRKLEVSTRCDELNTGTGHAAIRGYGEPCKR